MAPEDMLFGEGSQQFDAGLGKLLATAFDHAGVVAFVAALIKAFGVREIAQRSVGLAADTGDGIPGCCPNSLAQLVERLAGDTNQSQTAEADGAGF